MADDSDDKTEDPTGKRISESRKKGQVPRSKELNTFVTLMVSAALFFYTGGYMTQHLLEMLKHHLYVPRERIFDPAISVAYFKQAFETGFTIVAPFMLVLLVADLLTPLMMGGWNFTSEAFEPKFSRLNPLQGIKKIFGIQGVVELVKAILKVVLIGFVAWNLFKLNIDYFMSLSEKNLEAALTQVGNKIVFAVLILSATFLLLVMLDVPYQLWNHQRQLKMTKQEVKDEAKDAEGNPEIKGKIRQLQMQAAQRRMMEAVPKADVVVTNPTHFAVALQYDQNGPGAPVLVAKGTDLIAAQIRNIALEHKVTLVAAPQLARALYYSTELNQQIPRGLFLAVAQVLAYVFQLRAAAKQGWTKPAPPSDVQVPDEFRT